MGLRQSPANRDRSAGNEKEKDCARGKLCVEENYYFANLDKCANFVFSFSLMDPFPFEACVPKFPNQRTQQRRMTNEFEFEIGMIFALM